MKNAMQLKAVVKNIAKEKKYPHSCVQNYMFQIFCVECKWRDLLLADLLYISFIAAASQYRRNN